MHGSVILELVLLCNVYMIEIAICFAYVLKTLELLLVKIWIVIAEDLKGVLCTTVLRSANLCFKSEARTNGSSKGESVKSFSHFYFQVTEVLKFNYIHLRYS